MNTVIILTIIYMVALFVAIVVWLANCSRKERLARLKNFKRGRFVFIYFAVIPLFFLAHRFVGKSVEESLWSAVGACFEVVVLKFDYGAVAPLLAESVLFHAAVEVLFSLVILNTLLFTLSFCGQWVYNRASLLIAGKCSKKVVVIIGTTQNALHLLGSVPKGQKAVLFDELTPELKDEAFLRGAAACSVKEENLGAAFQKLFKNLSKRKVSVIMETGDDERTLRYVTQFQKLVAASDLTNIPITEDCGLSVHVFASKANAGIFEHYAETSCGIIRFVNRHEQIATDFIDKYPLTQFMTEREIDYSTATIRDEIQPNVFFVGFGKLNESLFLASVSNNEFLTMRDGKPVPKPVHYHLIDRYYPEGIFTENSEVYSGALHHGYLRYREFLKYYHGREDEFLPLVPMPAEVSKYPLEVNHPAFYATIRTPLSEKNSYNYIVISFGTDLENIELAEKLQQKLQEWEISAPVKIFVKVRDARASRALGGEFKDIIFFGANRECVYNAALVLREKTERMARLRHLLYTAEDVAKRQNSSEDAKLDGSIREAARRKWYSFKQYQREANLYACLSARMKLHLCGYDYAEEGEDCTADFLRAYEEADKRTPSPLTVAGKRVWEYSNEEQTRNSLRHTFAVQEHLRWCANMIANGFVPCKRSEILTLDKKEMLKKRKHGNLTTMEGLEEFRKIVADAAGKTEEETDVIRYDYQLMDDIDWLLAQCGYKIIKK